MGIAATIALLVALGVATRWLVRGMPVEVRSAAWWRVSPAGLAPSPKPVIPGEGRRYGRPA